MIFARYNGTDKQFTPGKVYPAVPEVESGDVANFGYIELRNDAGEKSRVKPRVSEFGEKTYDFEFLEEIYAVVVKKFDGLRVGQVVVLDNAQLFEGEKSQADEWHRIVYSVKGTGFRSAEYLVLLDRTNVFPGLVLLDLGVGNWVRVKSVDECLWVVTENNPAKRSPEEFGFAVDKDGDIQVEPLLKCKESDGQWLQKGHWYRVVREELTGNDRVVVVVNDLGVSQGYFDSRFLS